MRKIETRAAAALQAKLKTYTDVIIAEGSYYPQVLKAVQDIHALLVSTGAVDTNTDASFGTFTDGGYALSSVEAGRCAFDLARTRKFARGIIKAIKSKLDDTRERPVEILYAGCGPYAWLALLTCRYFDPSEIQFTLVDIHYSSVDSSKKIIEELGLWSYFKKIITADALTLSSSETGNPDIFITETMKTALEKEPQVSIALHFVPMLAPGGIMIPQSIRVTAVSSEINARQALQTGEDASHIDQPHSFVHGTVAELNVVTALSATNHKRPFPAVSFDFNKDLLCGRYELELQTAVQVWDDEIIEGFESALSLPVKIANGAELAGKTGIRFLYRNEEMPDFHWEIY